MQKNTCSKTFYTCIETFGQNPVLRPHNSKKPRKAKEDLKVCVWINSQGTSFDIGMFTLIKSRNGHRLPRPYFSFSVYREKELYTVDVTRGETERYASFKEVLENHWPGKKRLLPLTIVRKLEQKLIEIGYRSPFFDL